MWKHVAPYSYHGILPHPFAYTIVSHIPEPASLLSFSPPAPDPNTISYARDVEDPTGASCPSAHLGIPITGPDPLAHAPSIARRCRSSSPHPSSHAATQASSCPQTTSG